MDEKLFREIEGNWKKLKKVEESWRMGCPNEGGGGCLPCLGRFKQRESTENSEIINVMENVPFFTEHEWL